MATLTDANYQAAPANATLAILLASAGSPQTVYEGDNVNLGGTGYGLTYQWSQVSPASPVVAFADSTSPATSFTAPQLPGGFGSQAFTLQFTAYDGTVSTSSQVNVTVKNVNHPPVPQPGVDQTVNEGSAVALNGSASFDPDGDTIVSYQWTKTSGPAVTLIGANTATAGFTAPFIPGGVSGTLTFTFTLTVSDGVLSATSSPVTVTVVQVNHAPTARAGSPQTVNSGILVTLNGTGSSDPDSDPLFYSWTQPGGPAVTLPSPTAASPTFTAPVVASTTVLTFQLTVSDGQLSSPTPSQVQITVQPSNNAPPVCTAAQASPNLLWPPDHRMVPVSIIGVTDPNNDAVTITVTSVTQDEPVNGTGDGDTGPDAVIQKGKVLVRAERAGNGDGRVYKVNFTASDGHGGSCTGFVVVGVPHDMGRGKVPVDSGLSYNSLTGGPLSREEHEREDRDRDERERREQRTWRGDRD